MDIQFEHSGTGSAVASINAAAVSGYYGIAPPPYDTTNTVAAVSVRLPRARTQVQMSLEFAFSRYETLLRRLAD